MRIPFFLSICTFIIACGPQNPTDDSGDPQDTGEIREGYPSSFEAGSYRLSELSLNPLGEGVDQNGDGTADNNLPNALTLIDAALADQDFSFDGFNALIAASIEEQVLNVLVSAENTDRVLTLSVFSGNWDPEGMGYQVDPGSYDDNGDPISRMDGYFSSESEYLVGAPSAVLPVTFIIEDGPLPVPLINVTMDGSINGDLLSGQIFGVIPGDEMVSNVIGPMIPEEGVGGQTKEQILELVQTLTGNDTLMDVPLEGEQRGISAAFTFQAPTQAFALDTTE